MKKKQQVLSRFFAPKSVPGERDPPRPSHPSPSSSVQWPPLKTCASLRDRASSPSPIKKTQEQAFSPSARKRPLGAQREEDPVLVELCRPDFCSGAVSLTHEIDTQNGHVSGELEGATYKRRRKKDSLEDGPHSDREEASSSPALEQVEYANYADRPSVDSKESHEFPASDPTRHKKFVEKLLTSERPPHIPKPNKAPSKEQYTPLEQQVVELKAKYKDVLLMIEVGYRYRMFGEDAETAARVLGIFAYNDHNFITASVPTFRLHVHVRRLVEAGYKVGVVRQTETAAIKAHGGNKLGPFTRGLSALYSRATLEAAADLGGGEPCVGTGNSSRYLMCVTELVNTCKSSAKSPMPKPRARENGDTESQTVLKGIYDTTIGVVAVETATGDVMYGEFKDTVTRAELEGHLLTCLPAELLLASPLAPSTEKLLLDYAGPGSNVRIERFSRETLADGAGLSEVLRFYESAESSEVNHNGSKMEERVNEGLEAIMVMPALVVQALAIALRHLKEFGLEKVLRLGSTFRPFASSSEMTLSSNTLQQLEILQNNADGTTKGSLLWLMDHTHTAFGARLFHHWVTHPLRDQALISARLDAVSEIADSICCMGVPEREGTFPGSGRGGGLVGASSRGSPGSLGAVLMALKKIPDVERGITRIFHGTATAAEFVSVIQALLATVKELQWFCPAEDEESEMAGPGVERQRGPSSPMLRRLLATASSSIVSEHAVRLLSFINKDAASAGDKHNLFICGTGKFPMVEKCTAAVEAAEQFLESLLPQYKKLLRIPNLQFTSVSGTSHLIEVPAMQKVPQDWVKVCSTKKMNRYHSPEVLQGLDVLTLTKEELLVECNRAWESFLTDFASHYVDFRATVHALAALDCLYSLAIVSRNKGYTRPTFVQESFAQLIIEGGRHPVLEATLQEGFVPNDTCLHADNERCQIITGPNMGGKSCYIRQVALIAIMAQVGSYVPAISAKLHVFDGIYTRMGASDSIQRGSSTFMEELSEASTILRRATPYSLVIMDELGRGTSTHDGVAIAYATLEYLLENIRSLTLFVTHYPKLAELTERFVGKIGAYHVSYLAEACSDLSARWDVAYKHAQGDDADCAAEARKKCYEQRDVSHDDAHKITFLYKLVRGVASKSFGLHVARLAQIPEACISQASIMAAKLEKEVRARAVSRQSIGTALTGEMASKEARETANSVIRVTDENGGTSKKLDEPQEEEKASDSTAELSEEVSSVLSTLTSPSDVGLEALTMLQERIRLRLNC